MAPAAFVAATPIATTTNKGVNKCSTRTTTVRASAETVVEKNFPADKRNRAPTIGINQSSVSVSMQPIQAFTTYDKSEPLLLDYSDPDEFVPTKPAPASSISWPSSGDGRSNSDFKGVRSDFEQPNLKTYGPFPDFYKRSCDL